jgi:hypothetical protein
MWSSGSSAWRGRDCRRLDGDRVAARDRAREVSDASEIGGCEGYRGAADMSTVQREVFVGNIRVGAGSVQLVSAW